MGTAEGQCLCSSWCGARGWRVKRRTSILFQDTAQERKKDLENALQVHQYYADANEAESWMKEKEAIVSSGDYGKDEDSAEVGLGTCCVIRSGHLLCH